MSDETKKALLIVVFFIILLFVIALLSKKKKIDKMKEGVKTVKVRKHTPLPIYRSTLLWAFFEALVLFVAVYIMQNNLLEEFFPYYYIVPLICIITFFYKMSYQKTLCLLKNNDNVAEYCDNIQDFSAINSLYLHIIETISTHFSKKKSAHIISGSSDTVMVGKS